MAFCAHCGSHAAQVSFAPCASCGNPTNGAPPRTVRHSNTAAIVIGVIAGGFAVLAIISILAAVAIPNLLTSMQRSRQKRTMADIRAIATALEAYRTEKGVYPTKPELAGSLPERDAWTTPYSFIVTETEYFIGSAGADKTFDKALAEYQRGVTEEFDCDIIFTDGSFLQYPAGVTK
ncbi:MAG TPA: type II secretion system protein GspG [Thermoanaerobaculia bacterium]|nr:type II secretion system protein GspG [Thermoanaerobaculia bacterium]